jgi:hypothetical protein
MTFATLTFATPRPHPLRAVPGPGSALALIAVLMACTDPAPADDPDAAPEAATRPAATVTILEPADGAVVDGPDVRVRFTVAGDLRIVPAGDTTPATGHHHVYLDHDLGDPSEPVPTLPGAVVHVGTGADELVLENVAAGEHRLIAVVADGVHVPLQPWVVDTVHFRVR